jgi:hypothetical protein
VHAQQVQEETVVTSRRWPWRRRAVASLIGVVPAGRIAAPLARLGGIGAVARGS